MYDCARQGHRLLRGREAVACDGCDLHVARPEGSNDMPKNGSFGGREKSMAKGGSSSALLGAGVIAGVVGVLMYMGVIPDFGIGDAIRGYDAGEVNPGIPDSDTVRDKGGDVVDTTADKTTEYGVKFGSFIAIGLVALAAVVFWKKLGGAGRAILLVVAAVALTIMIAGVG